MIHMINGKKPNIKEEVFIAEGSKIIGEVYIEKQSSIWFNTIIRGDIGSIKIGSRTNIQENSTLHIDRGSPLKIGDNVTVGHNAVLHGCTIKDNCMIGMGSVVLNNAEIGENTIIGASALVPKGKSIPEGSLVLGIPGKVIRKLNENEIRDIQDSADHYYNLAKQYMSKE